MRYGMFFATGALVLSLAGCQKTGPGTATDSSSPPAAQASAPSAPPPPVAVQVPAGTRLEVRVDEALSTERDRAGDKFRATLEVPVEIGGREVLPRGARVTGHVTTSRPSGRLE